MERAAPMAYTALRLLSEHPDGIAFGDLWSLVQRAMPNLRDEWDRAGKSEVNLYDELQYISIDLTKAGLVTKRDRMWFPTPLTRYVLAQNVDAISILQSARNAYNYWKRNTDRFDRVRELAEAIPEGRWVDITEVARETGLKDETLVGWLQGERPTGWRRILDPGGHLPAAAHLGGDDRNQWLSILRTDGIDTEQGRADPTRRIPIGDLRDLVHRSDGEDAPRRAWLVRGSSVDGENLIRELWLPQGVCSLPASRLRDLPPGVSVERVREAIDVDYAHKNAQDRARLTAEYYAFLTRIREDDIVVTNDGAAVYLGTVTGAPSFVAGTAGRANLQRPVTWQNIGNPINYAELPDEFSARVANPDAQLIELTDFVEDLQRFFTDDAASPVALREVRLPDATEELAEELLIDRGWLQECVELLRERPQLVFYGPPGTGKTYLALHLAEHLAGGKPENVQLIQFHPAYSYEDFFEGYRPRTTGDGTIAFELVRGPFRRLAAAASDHPGDPYVLVIDEINRGDLAKIFGELYFLLEYRKRSVNLLYGSDDGQGFSLPPNLFILGTMNTADRSIALMDAAMRRRFSFVELHPDLPPVKDLLGRWLMRHEHDDTPARLLAELNNLIADRDFRIGPTYLMREAATTEEGLRRIWRTQLLPLLEEHHYGDGTDVRNRYDLDTLLARL